MEYHLWFIMMYPCNQTFNIRPNDCKLQGCLNPLQLYAVQLYTAAFTFIRKCKLPVTHSIVTCYLLYNHPECWFLFTIVFLTFPQPQAIATEPPDPGVIGAESSWTTGASCNTPLGDTQHQRRHHGVNDDAAIVAPENLITVSGLKMVCTTGNINNKKHNAIECESICSSADLSQWTISAIGGVRRELREQFMASRKQ
jgi:hypothetical protein